MRVADDVRHLLSKSIGVVQHRIDHRTVRARLAARGPLPAPVEAVLYFADLPVNLYQLRQWYEPMRVLGERHPVAVVARSPITAKVLLAECPLPVEYVPSMEALEPWLARQHVGAFFYVNQNAANFSTMRMTEPAHVFVSHGESDKAYMASNQLRAYDCTFVAGPAAVRRIEAAVYDLDPSRLLEIGRPQVDVDWPGPDLPDDGRTTVLYAPTWEGDRPSMSYSSLLTHGEALVTSLTRTGRHRVVYRPHPRTGVQDSRYRAAHRRVVAVLEAANRADAAARHVADTGRDFGWQVRAADVCVCDVSAVAFDWLASGKPIVLARPESPTAVLGSTGLAARAPLLTAADAAGAAELVDHVLATPDPAVAELTRDHFGDTSPGASMERFLRAASQVIEGRHRAQAERHATGAGH
ncbi:CDP-glycerol glycerophosphotransferase family protein [Cellulomonas alba]|uniref:CDP-glycerol glycerophosphotransferase family protein n=1 Tax=Cellulomonas alba TaxID=3053467 RepID=A0ABT7SER1_9CELL|nr:CDP-glycerol glycerophosphotransferase family protein [Cellulomonas alba]MDM7854024.1 CDP-glycerol glycerophosphotransferase family protein [Cellulomonas alba]